MYIGFAITRRLKFHMNNYTSISQYLKEHCCPHLLYKEMLIENTTILHDEKKASNSGRPLYKSYDPK